MQINLIRWRDRTDEALISGVSFHLASELLSQVSGNATSRAAGSNQLRAILAALTFKDEIQ